ncbi:PREDICTED: centromere/kinetochore protein zw10 homolog [Polistes dominula]|uniref:Centromere/kinetochore protein zw10 homolog n=1 Tax=Polistes dominula TaxID=743375 RepID=A0ABM1ISS5_POLDO|nr:PREDICTED: centromere/kinetochore protein zw10 homolog [Polistes dominula]
MTSFLTDVLITAEQVEKLNLQDKIAQIQEEIVKLKYDVKDFMDVNYIEFSSKLTKNQRLVSKAELLTQEMNDLQKRIDDQIKIELSGSTKELQNLSLALKESNLCFLLSKQLLSLDEYIKSIKQYQEEQRYVDAAKSLCAMQVLLENPENNIQDLEIYNVIKEEYKNLHDSFLSHASLLWHERICWTDVDDNKDEAIVTLHIKDKLENIEDLIRGLHYVNKLSDHLDKFLDSVMNHIIRAIINEECLVFVSKENVFTIKYIDRKKQPNYKSVLHNLKLLFRYLHEHFNIVIDNNESLLMKMQPYILDKLAESLTTNCIARTIPTSTAELKNFEPVIEEINDFQSYLVEIGFIKETQLFLKEYTDNIDTIFIDKICQDLMVKAKTIIRKDLHDSIKHISETPLKFPSNELENEDVPIHRYLNESSFQLSTCQISKSAKEILDLARSILDEACDSLDASAVRLFYTCRNIFEMYAGLVPEHHRKFLETIPQQVALFHNNCMYLAHHLLTLAHEYRDKLPGSLQQLNLTFADQTLILRNVGSECFLEHMRYQRNIIIDILKESGLAVLGQVSELPSSTERALRQCIRQLELLKTVWLDVLPINVYCTAVGCITNSMVEDLIIRVTSVEDIPADVASDLVIMFNMVATRAPMIFPESDEMSQYVRKWTKFVELIKVLGASLKEIEIRWANGKGPLAKEFTAIQVKQLIRALFQNTERRSVLLASIK